MILLNLGGTFAFAMTAVDCATSLRGSSVKPRHMKIVNAAEAYIEEHLDNYPDGFSREVLASHAGTSIRSLHRAFQIVLNTSPHRYILARRLDAVRESLRRASPGETVTIIALRHGFFEVGRFCAVYKKRFNEYPSQTLRGSSRGAACE